MGLKDFWRGWYKEEQRRDKKLIEALQSLGIYEQSDFEPIRDEVDEQVKQSEVSRGIRANPEVAESYTKKEQGIKASAVIEQWYDHGTNQDDINKAIERVAHRANEGKRKERLARKFIEHCISRGYYGYLLLRKWLGFPLEHPVLRPWYGDCLPQIPALINPGGRVTLLEGTYNLAGEIVPKSSVILEGIGWSTVLKPSGEIHCIHKEFTEDAKGSDIVIRSLKIDGASQSSNYMGIRIHHINHFKIEDVHISYPGKTGIYNCFSNDVWILNNLIEIDSSIGYGICSYGITDDGTGGERYIIENNIVVGHGYNGISTYAHRYPRVIGNYVKSGTGHNCIAFSWAEYGVIAGNIVRDATETAGEDGDEGGIELENGHGSAPYPPTQYCVVTGNIARNCRMGIYIRVSSKAAATNHIGGNYNLIIGNVVHDSYYGIKVHKEYSDGENKKNLIIGNRIYDCDNPITDEGIDTYIKGNYGYNPVGVFSITVGTSPFTYTAGSSPETVYIRGGTVSDISVDGTTLFTDTGHSIDLEPHQSVVITYSDAPTMTKYVH